MDGDNTWWINLQYQLLNTVNEIPELELYSTGSSRPIRSCKQMSITGFYDALSVKTWTENRLDAFQAYCAVQFAQNQETFMISIHTVPVCMCSTWGEHVFLTILWTGAFLYLRYVYSFLLISNKFCDFSLLHWPLFIWALNGTRLTARCHFPKKFLPLALVMDLPASKALRTGPYKS